MTKDDIIRMAREAGFEKVVAIDPDGSKTVTVAPVPELLAFANLVAAAEREEIVTALREALAQEHAMHELARLGQEIEQAEPPPEWPLIKNILAEYGLQAISFVADWKAAQRPWVGLTDNDWGWVADRKGTSLDTFDQGAAWAQARLKERNT